MEQLQQNFVVECSGSAFNTENQFSVRGNFINNTDVEFILYWLGTNNADETNAIKFQMLARINNFVFTDFSSPASAPEKLAITYAGKGVVSKSTVNSKMVEFSVIDKDIAIY